MKNIRLPFRTFIALLCLLLSTPLLFAQQSDDDEIVKQALIRQLGKIVIGNSSLPGNNAGFDIKNAQLTGSGSSSISDKGILNFNISAGVTEGIAALLNNTKASPNVSFGTKFSLLVGKRNAAIFNNDDWTNAQVKINSIDQDIANLRAGGPLPAGKNRRQAINEQVIKKRKLMGEVNPIGGRINWISIGYQLVNKNFYTFDSARTYKEQVVKQNFTSHQLSAEFNHYSVNNDNFGNWFVSAGVAFLIDDTKDQLGTTEISESYTYAGSPRSRSVQKKYTAYTGDYKQNIRTMKPSINFYYFLLRNNRVALHLFPETVFAKEHKPLTNLGTGLFFTFTDKDDKEGKAKINAELYVRFNDVSNNLGVETLKFYDKNDIGVRVTFPLTINP